MRFRPCIDIHNGKVKQIVGGSLKDEGNQASTNFTSELDAAWYARQYQKDHLKSGHNSFKSSWIRILRGDEKAGDGSSGGIPGWNADRWRDYS